MQDKKDNKKEEAADLSKVPAEVVAAAKKLRPKAKWLFVEKVEEGKGRNKKVAYELDGTDGKDRDVTMLVTEAGKVVEIETVLKNPSSPKEALAAVQKRWPKFDPTETHLLRVGEDLKKDDGDKEDGDGDRLYDMTGTIVKGRSMHVQVTKEGKILEWTVEMDESKWKDIPKEVTKALEEKHPKFTKKAAYELHDTDNKPTLIGYHFEGVGPKDKPKTISVSADGSQVELIRDDN